MGGFKQAVLLVAFLAHNVITQEDSKISSLSNLPADESEESEEIIENPSFSFNLSNTNFDDLANVLGVEFSKANVPSDKNQPIQFSLNITPPPNSGSEFVTKLEDAIKKIASKYAPFASTSIGIAITKNSAGVIKNLKVNITLTPPAKATLPPSTLPEIDLRKTTGKLSENLEKIVSDDVLKNGYDPDSSEVQDFSLEFNVLPPDGATRDYVKLNVVKPLQNVVRQILPRGSVTSISVNTLESNGKILRQTVTAGIRVKPQTQPKFSENIVEVPEIDLSQIGDISVKLQEIIDKENNKGETIAIPIKVKPTDEKEKDSVKYIEEVLKKIDPNTKVVKVTKQNLENGDAVYTVYVDFDETTATPTTETTRRFTTTWTTTARATSTKPTTTTTPRTTTTKPTTTTTTKPTRTSTKPTTTTTAKPTTTTTAKPTTTSTKPTTTTTAKPTTTTTAKPTTTSTKPTTTTTSRPTTTTTKPTTTTETVTTSRKPIVPEARYLHGSSEETEEPALPKNAIQTSVVDFTTANVDATAIFNVIEQALTSSMSLPADGSVVLAIPFKFPPISAEGSEEEEKIEKEINNELKNLLKHIEPSGEVVDTIGKNVADGYETIVYYKIPSLMNSTIYKVLQGKYKEKPVGKVVESPVINLLKPSVSPDLVEDEIKDNLQDILDSEDDKGGITIGFPVVIPGTVAGLVPSYANAIATILKKLEPSGVLLPNLVTKTLPDGNIQFEIYYKIPNIKNSNTYKNKEETRFDHDEETFINGLPIDNNKATIKPPENSKIIKNPINIPTIDTNKQINLLDTIKKTLAKTLDNTQNFEKNQQFNFEFKLNPYDFQGSLEDIAEVLKKLDPKATIDSYKLKSGADGFQYLDLGYLVPNFKKSPIFKLRNVLETVDIDAKKPFYELLDKVINVTDAAIDDVEGVKKGEDIDLNFGFKIVNSEGMSDGEVSNLIKRLRPSLVDYIREVLPDGRIRSLRVESSRDSDDVLLKFIVRTPYEPDDVIVIKNVVRKKVTTTTTTTTKRPNRGFLWFG